MRITAGVLLASLAFAIPAAAQTAGQEAKPEVKTEKLWKIEVTGISG